MLILALDQSTARGSLALLRNEAILDELSWSDKHNPSPKLFEQLTDLLKRTAVELSQIDCFALGLGPGSYSGLRTALAAVIGLALPDRRRVYGISSAEALARGLLLKRSTASLMVLGDARRNQFWARKFILQNGICLASTPWLLRPPQALAELAADIWVTSDWERIGTTLQEQIPASSCLITGQQWPAAGILGQAAYARMQALMPSEALRPIYLHSAVAQPPLSGSRTPAAYK